MADNDDFIENGMPEPEADIFDPQSVEREIEQRDNAAKAALAAAVAAIRRRQEAYVRFFKGSPMPGDVEIVMGDIMHFCRGDMSAFHENERIHVLLTGRQEVYWRIKDHIEMPFEDLVEKYQVKQEE